MFPDVAGIAAVIVEIKAMEAEMKKKGMLRDPATGKYHVTPPKEVDDVRVVVVKDYFTPDAFSNTTQANTLANKMRMAEKLAVKLIEEGLVEFDVIPPGEEGVVWEGTAKINVVKRTSD